MGVPRGVGRNIVVDRGHRAVRLAHLAPGGAQAIESLRRSHFVNQVQVDIEQRLAVRGGGNDVLVPNFLE